MKTFITSLIAASSLLFATSAFADPKRETPTYQPISVDETSLTVAASDIERVEHKASVWTISFTSQATVVSMLWSFDCRAGNVGTVLKMSVADFDGNDSGIIAVNQTDSFAADSPASIVRDYACGKLTPSLVPAATVGELVVRYYQVLGGQ